MITTKTTEAIVATVMAHKVETAVEQELIIFPLGWATMSKVFLGGETVTQMMGWPVTNK